MSSPPSRRAPGSGGRARPGAPRGGGSGLIVLFVVIALIALSVAGFAAYRAFSGGGGGPVASGPSGSSPPPTTGGGKIQHIVFMVRENRSFDNLFGTFPGANGTTTGELSSGQKVALGQATDQQNRDLGHGFLDILTGMNGGKMNGWDQVSGNQHRLLSYTQFHQDQIPDYWKYAQTFTLADGFFASAIGPSPPNHLFTLGASAAGYVGGTEASIEGGGRGPNAPVFCDSQAETSFAFRDNLTAAQRTAVRTQQNNVLSKGQAAASAGFTPYWVPSRDCVEEKILPDELDQAGVSWKYYASPDVWKNAFLGLVEHARSGPEWNHVSEPWEFLSDVQNGTLPQVSWLIPPKIFSDHPGGPNSVCAGENWTVQQVNAIMNSPYWAHTAIVITWDESGGYYDHVAPPRPDIFGMGPRVPTIIISPYAKRGFVDHTTYEFASVLRFIEDTFHLQPLTDRDGKASPLAGAFDFKAKPNLTKLVLPLRTDCPYGNSDQQIIQESHGRSGG